jgi:hypothetical protein
VPITRSEIVTTVIMKIVFSCDRTVGSLIDVCIRPSEMVTSNRQTTRRHIIAYNTFLHIFLASASDGSSKLCDPFSLCVWKDSPVSLDTRFAGPQRSSGLIGEEKIPCSYCIPDPICPTGTSRFTH